MSDNITPDNTSDGQKPPVGNLTDFVYGVDEKNPLYIEVAVNDTGKVVVFHDKPFRTEVSWFEFDLETSKLSFIMDGGEIRETGMTLAPAISKNMQNSHQVLMVLLDNDTGEAKEGNYVPLIIHKS